MLELRKNARKHLRVHLLDCTSGKKLLQSKKKKKKTLPSIGRWWRCWRGIFCSVFLLASQFFPETTLQREITRSTLLLVSFSLYAAYTKIRPREQIKKAQGASQSDQWKSCKKYEDSLMFNCPLDIDKQQ